MTDLTTAVLAISIYVGAVIMFFAAIGWLWILYDGLCKPWQQRRRQKARIKRQMRS